jgi:23S rRNA maturation-related 3'-5' exoribonuclease YhaM
MVLEKERIVANTKKYFDTATKLGFMTEELMSFLGEDFIKAPASTMTDLHNAFEGGLIEHLLTVAKYAVLVNKSLPDDEKVDQDSLLKVCLLHQIGKAKLYKPCESEWHVKKGYIYEFKKDTTPIKVNELSLHYATSNGVIFTDEEFSAIINFEKSSDDLQSKYHNSMLGELLKMGSVLAIKHAKKNK